MKKASRQSPAKKQWPPLQFIIDMLHGIKMLISDTIKSRKWSIRFWREKGREGDKTYSRTGFQIDYNKEE